MVVKLKADTKHVEHIQDFSGDPLTRVGAQSQDGKAAYVQVYLAGNMGEALANESVKAVQEIVAGLSPVGSGVASQLPPHYQGQAWRSAHPRGRYRGANGTPAAARSRDPVAAMWRSSSWRPTRWSFQMVVTTPIPYAISCLPAA
jgi:uncharacterized membrane protein YdfJ with MMPL/SSD domain